MVQRTHMIGNAAVTVKENESMPLLKIGPSPTQEARSTYERIIWDEKGRTKFVQMFISYGKYIKSIAFQYIEDGKLVMSPNCGSPNLDESNFISVMLDASNEEYITRLGGSYGTKDYNIGEGVTSLTIETNVATYGPFGNHDKNDPKFNLSFGPENQIGGFHGITYKDTLAAIGVYVRPIHDLATFTKKTELLVE